MAGTKSALAERAKELEEAVTRLFTGQGPAPKPRARKPARKPVKKARHAKKAKTAGKRKARR